MDPPRRRRELDAGHAREELHLAGGRAPEVVQGRDPAQHLLDTQGHAPRIPGQRPPCLWMLDQRLEPAREQALGDVVSGHDELHEEAGELRFAAERGIHQQPGQVPACAPLALLRQPESVGSHRHRCGVARLSVVVRLVEVHDPCAPVAQLAAILVRAVHQFAGQPARQLGRHEMHEVELARVERVHEDLHGQGTRASLERRGGARREGRRELPAQLLVLGRIHARPLRAQHGELRGIGREVHHALAMGRERQRIVGDAHHVGVAGDGPEGGDVVALVPEARCGLP